MATFRIEDIPNMYRRARALQASGRLAEARVLYEGIVAVRPQTAEAHFEIGRITHRTGDYGTALKALDLARRQRPREPAVLRERAQVLSDLGRTDAAIDALRELQAVLPGEVSLYVEIGLLEQRAGRQDRAEAAFREAQKLSPEDGELYRLRMSVHRGEVGRVLIDEMRGLHSSGRTAGASRAGLCFALAGALEQTGAEPGEVWRYLEEGNELVRSRFPYDPAAREAEDAAHLAALDSLIPGDVPELGPFRPVFITGMPRSGTTLVEQILASHSQVTGGGEMAVTGPLLRQVLNGQIPPAGFAGELERTVRRKLVFDKVYTDKSLQSYRSIGALAALLPGAPIIVIHRDPRDQLFSIYRQVFRQGRHRYAYGLNDLAHAYAAYRRLLRYWRERAPGAFIEFSYEGLVAHPDAGARRLIDAAGLDWEAGVMAFHGSTRDVRTLSTNQVREPVHDRSVGSWRPYAPQLAPLLGALDDYGLLPD